MKTIVFKVKPIPVNQRTMIVSGRQTSSKKWKDTKLAMSWETKAQWPGDPLTEDITLNVLLYFGDKRRRDIDAYIKILLDSMEGVVYENDAQVTELHVYKDIDLDDPRVVVQIL